MDLVFTVAAGISLLLWAGRLMWWDLKFQRLPNHLTIPSAIIMTLGAVVTGHSQLVAGGVVWSGLYFLGALWSRGGLGGGDVKLAFSLGIIAGVGGVWAVILAMIFSNIIAVFLLIKQDRHVCPHGPPMFAGTFMGLVIGGTITTW